MLETVRCAESSSLRSPFPFFFPPSTGHDAIGSVTSLTKKKKKANLRVWIRTRAETKQSPLRKETQRH